MNKRVFWANPSLLNWLNGLCMCMAKMYSTWFLSNPSLSPQVAKWFVYGPLHEPIITFPQKVIFEKLPQELNGQKFSYILKENIALTCERDNFFLNFLVVQKLH